MNGGRAASGELGSLDRFITDRLRAERVQESDFSNLRQMDVDARIMDTMGGVRTEDQTRAYLDTNLEHWKQNGFGLWMLRLREDNRFVGRAYLRHLHIAENDEMAIGYALLPEFWGLGLATEVARAIVRIAFEHCGLESLVVGAVPDNAASRRVIEKVGGRYERETVYKGNPHVLYRIARGSSETAV